MISKNTSFNPTPNPKTENKSIKKLNQIDYNNHAADRSSQEDPVILEFEADGPIKPKQDPINSLHDISSFC